MHYAGKLEKFEDAATHGTHSGAKPFIVEGDAASGAVANVRSSRGRNNKATPRCALIIIAASRASSCVNPATRKADVMSVVDAEEAIAVFSTIPMF